jgi:hypothetical protein
MKQAYTTWMSQCFPDEQNALDGENFGFDLNIDFGQRYHASAAIAYISGTRGPIYEDPFLPSTLPGSKAPHIWFRRSDAMKSLFDYFELRKFVLVCSGRGTAWITAKDNHFQNLPLKVAVVPLGEFFSKYQIRDTGAVLIRPDGMIGWKATDDLHVGKLGNVLRQLLGLNIEEEHDKPPQLIRPSMAPNELGVREMESEDKASSRKGPASLLRRMTTLRLNRKRTS